MKDYTKFSKEQKEPNASAHPIKVEVPRPKDEHEPTSTEVIAEPEPHITGVVIECEKLNVRRGPYMISPVLCTVRLGEELIIDEKESTNEFYKVCTAEGTKGYCMKKFINANK